MEEVFWTSSTTCKLNFQPQNPNRCSPALCVESKLEDQAMSVPVGRGHLWSVNQTHLLYVTTLLCQFLSVTAWNIPICFSSLDPTESWRIFFILWHVTGDLIEKIRVTAEISVKFKTPSFPHSVSCRASSDWSQGGSEGWQRHCLPKISNHQDHLSPGWKDKLWTEGRV